MSETSHRRPSPVFLALVAVVVASGWALCQLVDETTAPAAAGFAVFAFVISGWVVSLCVHEYAHARSALASGDTSVELRGYLTLNPVKYTHALLSIVLPLLFVIAGGIGLPGGAVYIEHARIPGRLRHSVISAAGPLTNALFAVVLLVPLSLDPGAETIPAPFQAALAFLGLLQITAALLNLIPVPGLDGYGIVDPWLSDATRRALAPYASFGLLVVFGLLWVPELNREFFGLVDAIFGLFGIQEDLPAVGQQLFRFWEGR